MKRMTKWAGFLALAIILPTLALAAGGKASTASNGMLNHVFRTTSYTAPTNVYIGLLTTCPTTGNNGTELTSGNGYTTRSAAIAKGDSSWTYTAATFIGASTITNAGAIAGSTAWTAGTSWTLNCFGVYDSATIGAGNLIYWGPLTGAPVTVGAGATASFPIGSLTITEN